MCRVILAKLSYIFCCGCCKKEEISANEFSCSNTRNEVPPVFIRNNSGVGSIGQISDEEGTMSYNTEQQGQTTESHFFTNQIRCTVNQSMKINAFEQDHKQHLKDILDVPMESSFDRPDLEVIVPENEQQSEQKPKISVSPNRHMILVKEETDRKEGKPMSTCSIHQSSPSLYDTVHNLASLDDDITLRSVLVNAHAGEIDININNEKEAYCTQERCDGTAEIVGQREVKEITNELSEIWINPRAQTAFSESKLNSIDLRQQVLKMKLKDISTRKFEGELNLDHGEALFFVARSLNFTREELQTVRNCQSGGGQPNAQFVHYLCSTDVTTEDVLRGLNNIGNTEGAHILQEIVNEKGYKYFYKLEPKETLKLFDPLSIDPTIPGAEVKGWKGLAEELDMNEEMYALAKTSTNLGIYSGGEGFMQIMRAKNGTVGDLLNDLHKLNEDEQELNLTSVIGSFEECIFAKMKKMVTCGKYLSRMEITLGLETYHCT